MKNRLQVKAWFADKEDIGYTPMAVIEIREKAVKLAFNVNFRVVTAWCPKSCLEISECCFTNEEEYRVIPDGYTLEQAINYCYKTFEKCVEDVRYYKFLYN